MNKLNLSLVGLLFAMSFLTSCSQNDIENDLVIAGLKGKVKTVIIKHSTSNGKEMFLGEIHRYNLNGYETEKEEFYNDDLKIIYTRDEKNNIVEEKAISKNSEYTSGWVKKNKYDKENKLIESTTINENKIYELYEYKYDINGNIISEITTYPKEYANVKSTSYKYDKNNNIIELIVTSSNSKGNYDKWIYKYDDNNNKIYESEINEKGEIGITGEYKYDENDNVLEEKNFYQNKKVSITKFYYENNKLIEEKRLNKDGSLEWIVSYDYDEKGNWIKKTTNKTNGNVDITLRLIEYYSEDEELDAEIENTKLKDDNQRIKTNETVTEKSNFKKFDEIELTLMDGSLKKAKLYLGDPDKYEYTFGHETKGFAVYYNIVDNQNGEPKHLVLFLRIEGNQWGNSAKIEEIYSVQENEEACFGIHCIKIENQIIYTNAHNLIRSRGYESL